MRTDVGFCHLPAKLCACSFTHRQVINEHFHWPTPTQPHQANNFRPEPSVNLDPKSGLTLSTQNIFSWVPNSSRINLYILQWCFESLPWPLPFSHAWAFLDLLPSQSRRPAFQPLSVPLWRRNWLLPVTWTSSPRKWKELRDCTMSTFKRPMGEFWC